eukprot:TRINITY_DN346_c1_g1_i1.p1 TRINITY_DN346_c1_g1~~TRINITY_DN346_c1_g1_i1.p1  ORF type:complete len:819 (-),score=126.21 TRINITY_DN346_c1_g1_i1:65-2521(-)
MDGTMTSSNRDGFLSQLALVCCCARHADPALPESGQDPQAASAQSTSNGSVNTLQAPPAGEQTSVEPRKSLNFTKKKGEKLLDKYSLGDVIGQGAFGVVYKCAKKETGQEFAVKMIDMVETPLADIKREAEMLGRLHHPCVVKLHDVYYEKVFVCMVMDIIKGGDMIDGMQAHWEEKGMMPVHVLQNVSKQMVEGIAWMHQNGVVHRDVKGDNYLMDRKDIADPECRIFVADFGTACECKEGMRLSSACGTKTYWSPEFYRKNYAKKVDIWAIGVVMYGLLSSRFPFKDENSTNNKKLVVSSRCGKLLQDCILKMLERDEKQRFDATATLECPFFVSVQSAASAEIEAMALPEDFKADVKETGANAAVAERRKELVERLENAAGVQVLSARVSSMEHIFLQPAFEIAADRAGSRKSMFAWWDESKMQSAGLLNFDNAKTVSSQDMQKDADSSMESIGHMLEQHNIKTDRFGEGEAKEFSEFVLEVQNGESQLMLDATRHKSVVRVVEVALVRITALVGGKEAILLQLGEKFEDGRPRPGKSHQLPGSKKRPYESGQDAVERIFRERLNVTEFSKCIKIDINRREYVEEAEESSSYPGVRTVYRKEIFACSVESANESIVQQLAQGQETRSYGWLTEAECTDLGVTVRAPQEAGSFSALVNAPVGYTYDELVTCLQQTGFDMSGFGKGTTKSLQEFSDELLSGVSALIKKPNGTLVREVDVVILKLSRPDGRILVEESETVNGIERNLGRLPAVKRRSDENQFSAARRLVRKTLQMDDVFVSISPNDVIFLEEQTVSRSYECLTTLYRKRIISARLNYA